jgi:hypothetical protein
MKKLLRSTFGTLVVATFLAITPPMYARGGHGGRGHGHSISHATRGHAGFGVRGGRRQRFVGHARANTRFAGRAFRATRGGWGRGWGVVIGIRTPDIPGSAITARVTVIHITDLTVTPPVGTTIHITGIILTGTDTGPTGA